MMRTAYNTPQIETFAQSEYFATATPKISRVTTLLFVLWVTLTIFSFSFPQTNQSHQNYRIPRDNLTLYLCFEFPRYLFLLSVAWWKKSEYSRLSNIDRAIYGIIVVNYSIIGEHRGQLQYHWCYCIICCYYTKTPTSTKFTYYFAIVKSEK